MTVGILDHLANSGKPNNNIVSRGQEIAKHPATAFVTGGLVVYGIHKLGEWAGREADIAWWKDGVRETAIVYMNARSKELNELDDADITQISAAAGCQKDVGIKCLNRIKKESSVKNTNH